jgi:hypothetical protein
LERLVFPALSTGFEVANPYAQRANLVLFVGTALFPSVAAVAIDARLAGVVLVEG